MPYHKIINALSGRIAKFIYVIAAILLVIGFIVTSVSIAPAPDTVETSNIPPAVEVNWGSDNLSEDYIRASTAFYACEYSRAGHAAMKSIIDVFGQYPLEDDDTERAEATYGEANKQIANGLCEWSWEGYLFGYLYNTDEYNFDIVECQPLPNGACISIQPVREKFSEETVPAYILYLTDEEKSKLRNETVTGGNGRNFQWVLIN